jgi:predicted transcriptional regulator
MTNVKQQVREILEQLPDDCSIEDVPYRLYVVETIRRRSETADRGEFASEAEVEQKLSKWLPK